MSIALEKNIEINTPHTDPYFLFIICTEESSFRYFKA